MKDNNVTRDLVETIPVTPMIISEAVHNGVRQAIVLRNTSLAGEIISVATGAEAKNGQGIVLYQGDERILSRDGGYTPPQTFITAIASVGTATLSIHEEIILE